MYSDDVFGRSHQAQPPAADSATPGGQVFFFTAEIREAAEEDRLAESMGDEVDALPTVPEDTQAAAVSPSGAAAAAAGTEGVASSRAVSFHVPASPSRTGPSSRSSQPLSTKAARRRDGAAPAHGLAEIRQALLQWLNSHLARAEDGPDEVKDLTTSLRDGRVLQAVLQSLCPERCEYRITGDSAVDLGQVEQGHPLCTRQSRGAMPLAPAHDRAFTACPLQALEDAYQIYGVEKLLDPADELCT